MSSNVNGCEPLVQALEQQVLSGFVKVQRPTDAEVSAGVHAVAPQVEIEMKFDSGSSCCSFKR